MDKLISWVLGNCNPNATNIVIGGHYNFPDTPNNFSINSIVLSKAIADSTNKSILFSFINDIGFNNFCNYGICQIPIEKKNNQGIIINNVEELWDKKFDEIKLIEVNTGIVINPDFILQCKNILFSNNSEIDYNYFSTFFMQNYKQKTSLITTEKKNISSLFYLIKACSASEKLNRLDNLKWSIDYFFYHFDKENFQPIIYRENNVVCKTLYEKSIYNSSSKTLRKLSSRVLLKDLIIDKQGSQIIYKCKSFVGNDIVLRIEDSIDNSFNAVNKCPSIIASLYYKIVKDNCKTDEINIIYNVPSYDRIKVDLGTEAFFSIYFPYLKQNFGINKVNIININWIDNEGSCMTCDRYTSKNSYTFFLTNQ